MWFKAGISLGVVLAFGAGLWWVKSRLDLLEATQTRLAQVEQMLVQSRNDLEAERLARKLDAQEATTGFEKADWACQKTVRQAVAGTRVKPIPAQEIIKYVETPVGNSDCPSVRIPDYFRVSDIQRAGTDPD